MRVQKKGEPHIQGAVMRELGRQAGRGEVPWLGREGEGLIGLCPALSEADITPRVRLAGKCGCEFCLRVEMLWVTRGLQGSLPGQ